MKGADDPVTEADLAAAGVLRAALLRPPVYALVKPLAKLPLGGLTNLAIDYLVLYHYLEGMKSPLEGRP